ncbi:MAG: SH3 domain-containing protein, partial [Pyrinomonadaceae bacterium]
MPKAEDILWFKQQFHGGIGAAVQGTPFSLDMLTAIACQETGYIWQILRRRSLGVGRILELCVGDTIDAKPNNKGRRVFPRTKAELVSKPNGEQMFGIARQALVDMARYVPGYESAVAKPHKFCHGFGIFQYDLQFFLREPEYFLQKRYADFDACLEKCLGELRSAMRRIGWEGKAVLSELEMA